MKYKLRLFNLKCYLSDESDGDEIFIRLNGEKVWPTTAKFQTVLNETTPLNLEYLIEKNDQLDLELWDYDTLSANDLLGTLTIHATSHGFFTTEFLKKGNDTSKYALEYEIG